MTTITTSNLGFPRLGRKRKKPSRAIGLKIDKAELDQKLSDLHRENLLLQKL